MYDILPEVPQPLVTAALKSFRLTMNTLPESLHDLSFQKATRDMLKDARQRLASCGYDLSKGLKGLRDPRRCPGAGHPAIDSEGARPARFGRLDVDGRPCSSAARSRRPALDLVRER
jgi:hypothetical protein